MLLPYASDRPPRQPPLVVVSLVLIDFALFGLFLALTTMRSGERAIWWYTNLGLTPGQFAWYAPLTYSFLHVSLLHVSVNMLFLWVFGGSVEDAIGWKRFLLVYMVGAVLTGLFETAMEHLIPGINRQTPIFGASGAVAAMMGIFAVRFYRSRIRFIGLPFRVPALALVAAVMVGEMALALWQLIGREADGTQLAAHWAHVAGFLFGIGCAQLLRLFQAGRHEYLAADAALAMEQGSPLSAARRWEAILQAQPGNLHAKGELARAWATAGDEEQGLPAYRAVIRDLLERGDRRGVAERFQEMVRFYPRATFPPAEQLAIARALEDQQAHGPAAAAFGALAREHPDAPEAELATLRAGVLRVTRLGEREEGVRLLERFLERYPRSALRDFAEHTLRAARKPGPGDNC